MDTLTINERLTKAGVPPPQARAHARVHTEVADDLRDDMAHEFPGKADVASLKAEIVELRVAIAEMESRMTWRLVGATIGGITALAAIFGVMLTIQFQMLAQIIAGG